VHHLVVVEREQPWLTPGAIEDCGNFSLTTQAAARTLALVVTEFRNQIEFLFHPDSPISD
jgi:hypothetical protein